MGFGDDKRGRAWQNYCMSFKPLKIGRKTFLIVAESLMVLAVLVIIAGGVLMWRLNQGKLEIGFARKFIESELSDPARNLSLQVGQVFLDWSALDSRPQISLNDVRLVDTQKDQPVLAFESASITLSRAGILVGNIAPRSIIINKPLITVVRAADGSVELAVAKTDTPKPQSDNDTEEIIRVLDMMAKPPRDLPRDWPLRSLRLIMITDARMMVEDHVLKKSWLVPKIELAFRRGQGNLVTSASLWLENEQLRDPTVAAEAMYAGNSGNIVADMVVNDLHADFLAAKFPDLDWLRDQVVALDGRAQVILDPAMKLTGLSAKLESRDGALMIPDVYDRALPYQSLALNLAYTDADHTLVLSKSDLVLADDFSLSVDGKVTQGADGAYNIPFNILVHSLPQARVAEFWPKIMEGEGAEEWALKRLSKGRIYDSTINMVLNASREKPDPESEGGAWSVELADLKTDFLIENMTVDYSTPLMPVTAADGKGHFDYQKDQMTIDVTKGMLGDLTIQSGKIFVDTVVGSKIGHATIDTHLTGPLKTVFKYIADEPIGVKDIPTDINKIEGVADLTLNVSFPTLAELPAEKIIVKGDGTVNNATLPGLVAGLDVGGSNIKVSVKDNRLDVAGKGTLSGRDMDFTFAQYFESAGKAFSAQAVASVMVDPELRRHFGMDLSDWMEGSVPAKITYTELGGGKTEVDAVVDATAATLMVKPMNYTKPAGIKASASAKAILVNGNLTEIRNLVVETPDGRTDGASMSFAQSGKETVLTKGAFPRSRLYESDVALDFTMASNVITLNMKGSFLDGRPFLENNKKGGDYTGPGLNANVAVTRMRTTEARMIDNVRLGVRMDQTGDLQQLEMNANAGRGKILFSYKPDASQSKMTLRIESDDAGATLKAFDVYENAVGGAMLVVGESAPGGDKKLISGKAELTNFRVVNAPVLARLVNALSLPGIIQLLGSDGISFTRLESNFSWQRMKGGDMISMKDGRTSGSSMGLTFEGQVDRIQQTINVTGTIVPVTLVNDILGSIPLLGDILSGGSDGGVFAATYSVRGPVKNPTIMVNPLAVLTPGFLRRIFFE